MNFLDIVDVLREQHDEIRRLCSQVARSQGDEKKQWFTELSRTVHLHERGERAIVHPAISGVAPTGHMVGTARVLEEGVIERSLSELDDLATRHPNFDRRFEVLHRAILDHMTREELDEYPLLRTYVPAQRLHWMVGELHDIQVLDAA